MGAKSTDASSGAIPAAVAPSSLSLVFVNSKTIVKAFDLPLVSDTYNSLVKLFSPLNPIVKKIGSLTSPAADQIIGLRAGIEAKVPDVVSTGFNSALAQVSSVAVSLDAKFSSGIDNLVEEMPALKEATPALYESTRQSVRNYATFAATYLASYTLAHVVLKATDLSLEITDGLLIWSANEKVDPILVGLRRLRSDAEHLRRQGVGLNGTEKAKVLEEATLVGALVEIFGLASFFSKAGNDEEALTSEVDDDAIDVANLTPTKTDSGQKVEVLNSQNPQREHCPTIDHCPLPIAQREHCHCKREWVLVSGSLLDINP